MSKICCFTGSRDLAGLDCSKISLNLEKVLADLIENEGYTDFRAGGARGFDTLAALYILELKTRHPHVKLHLILPCKTQNRYFSRKEDQFYKMILERADTVTYIQEEYGNGVMFRRNRALVDGADMCVALLRKSSGGTYMTVKYAQRQGVEFKNLMNLLK